MYHQLGRRVFKSYQVLEGFILLSGIQWLYNPVGNQNEKPRLLSSPLESNSNQVGYWILESVYICLKAPEIFFKTKGGSI